jgi:hypothetical protein
MSVLLVMLLIGAPQLQYEPPPNTYFIFFDGTTLRIPDGAEIKFSKPTSVGGQFTIPDGSKVRVGHSTAQIPDSTVIKLPPPPPPPPPKPWWRFW